MQLLPNFTAFVRKLNFALSTTGDVYLQQIGPRGGIGYETSDTLSKPAANKLSCIYIEPFESNKNIASTPDSDL